MFLLKIEKNFIVFLKCGREGDVSSYKIKKMLIATIELLLCDISY